MPYWMNKLHTIYCIGLNYHDHAAETNQDVPQHPIVFMKPKSAIVESGGSIAIPKICTHGPELDYEGELAVVIGKTGKDIPLKSAEEHILGYCVANDVSARRWQRHAGGKQWIRGKSFDGFCALSDELLAPKDVEDPQNLSIRTLVDGELRQDGNTKNMIFSVSEIIHYLSQDTTLLEGTIILTGTPAGVGVAMDPPRFLEPGQTVEISIEGIGRLQNEIE